MTLNPNRPLLLRFRKGLRTKAQKAANTTHDGNLTAWLNDLIEKHHQQTTFVTWQRTPYL
jgi:hypothetical protein